MVESQQYIYVIKPSRLGMLTDGPSAYEEDIVARHFSYLEALANEGIVILAGRTQTSDDSAFGVVILNAGSEREARERMEADPAVEGGVMRAKLFPFRIALKS
jgi:uncharacterized protein YciI